MFAQGHAALCKYYQQQKKYNNITLVDIGGRIQHAEKEKIRAIAERQMQRYLKELLNALREHGLDLKLPVVFTGGGAELLGHRLYSREINATLSLTVSLTPKAISFCGGKEMRERRYLTFDMGNTRHRKAFAIFSAQSAKHCSEYVVDCIIKAQDENRLVESTVLIQRSNYQHLFLNIKRKKKNLFMSGTDLYKGKTKYYE